MVIIRYTFQEISQYWNEQLAFIVLFLRYINLYFIVYFVFRKASKQIVNKERWINYGLIPVFIVSFVVNVGIVGYLEISFLKANDVTLSQQERNYKVSQLSCTSPIWMSIAISEFFSLMIFLGFVIKVEEVTED